jgi:hypothetical protein
MQHDAGLIKGCGPTEARLKWRRNRPERELHFEQGRIFVKPKDLFCAGGLLARRARDGVFFMEAGYGTRRVETVTFESADG